MAPRNTHSALVNRFVDAASKAGSEATVTSRSNAPDAIESACTGATVASTRLLDDIPLPEDVVVNPTFSDLSNADTGITGVAFAIASYGSVVVPSAADMAGPVSLYPPRHVAVVRARDIEPDMTHALTRMDAVFKNGTDDVVIISGPSSTGDMGALVRGVHGPGELHIVVIE